MRLRNGLFGCVVLLVAAGGSARADLMISSGGSAGFQSVGTLSESGPAYWASGSFDGSKANIGYFLNGGGYYTSQYGGTSPGIAVGDMAYWGTSTGAADTDLTFTSTGKVSVELLLTLAGDHAVNEFGWYKAGDAGSKVKLFQNGYNAGDGTQSIVFGNNAGYGVSPLAATFNPGGGFGFYITNGLGQTFFTETSLNTAGAINEFAIFRSLSDAGNSVLYLGAEDRLNGDFDYNDTILRVRSASAAVPEPASITMVAIAGLCLGAGRVMRRRRLA